MKTTWTSWPIALPSTWATPGNVAAAIGAGGLGEFIFRGLSMVDDRVILAGAIPAALLALVADFGVGWLERLLQPR